MIPLSPEELKLLHQDAVKVLRFDMRAKSGETPTKLVKISASPADSDHPELTRLLFHMNNGQILDLSMFSFDTLLALGAQVVMKIKPLMGEPVQGRPKLEDINQMK